MLAGMQRQQAAFQAAAPEADADAEPEANSGGAHGKAATAQGTLSTEAASLPECVLCSQATEAEGVMCWLVGSSRVGFVIQSRGWGLGLGLFLRCG